MSLAKRYAKERDRVFTDAVINNNWEGVKRFNKKWNLPEPRKESALKAGVYKAVRECASIPQEVKDKAFVECLKLGYTPFMKDIKNFE